MAEAEETISVEDAFKQLCESACAKAVSKKYQVGETVDLKIPLCNEDMFDQVRPFVEITEVNLSPIDDAVSVKWDADEDSIVVAGVPGFASERMFDITYKLAVESNHKEIRHVSFFGMKVNPDPKTLWRDEPTDANEPYQAESEATDFKTFDEKIIIGASKRGRSHAHYGKFRDDNFLTAVFPDTGWAVVVVSDGAGSAKFSREGSRITCKAFVDFVAAKLSSPETNQKLDSLEKDVRDDVLKDFMCAAAYDALRQISEEAQRQSATRKDYHATMLAYLLRKVESGWLIVSMGIGDGIMAVIDDTGSLKLLSQPDNGEFVGQTRFITMNEVWENGAAKGRVRILEVKDFKAIFSMTDGVSDPMFETDAELEAQGKWDTFQSQLGECLVGHDEACAQKLCDWLDFWSRGNHDDRTITVVY